MSSSSSSSSPLSSSSSSSFISPSSPPLDADIESPPDPSLPHDISLSSHFLPRYHSCWILLCHFLSPVDFHSFRRINHYTQSIFHSKQSWLGLKCSCVLSTRDPTYHQWGAFKEDILPFLTVLPLFASGIKGTNYITKIDREFQSDTINHNCINPIPPIKSFQWTENIHSNERFKYFKKCPAAGFRTLTVSVSPPSPPLPTPILTHILPTISHLSYFNEYRVREFVDEIICNAHRSDRLDRHDFIPTVYPTPHDDSLCALKNLTAPCYFDSRVEIPKEIPYCVYCHSATLHRLYIMLTTFRKITSLSLFSHHLSYNYLFPPIIVSLFSSLHSPLRMIHTMDFNLDLMDLAKTYNEWGGREKERKEKREMERYNNIDNNTQGDNDKQNDSSFSYSYSLFEIIRSVSSLQKLTLSFEFPHSTNEISVSPYRYTNVIPNIYKYLFQCIEEQRDTLTSLDLTDLAMFYNELECKIFNVNQKEKTEKREEERKEKQQQEGNNNNDSNARRKQLADFTNYDTFSFSLPHLTYLSYTLSSPPPLSTHYSNFGGLENIRHPDDSESDDDNGDENDNQNGFHPMDPSPTPIPQSFINISNRRYPSSIPISLLTSIVSSCSNSLQFIYLDLSPSNDSCKYMHYVAMAKIFHSLSMGNSSHHDVDTDGQCGGRGGNQLKEISITLDNFSIPSSHIEIFHRIFSSPSDFPSLPLSFSSLSHIPLSAFHLSGMDFPAHHTHLIPFPELHHFSQTLRYLFLKNCHITTKGERRDKEDGASVGSSLSVSSSSSSSSSGSDCTNTPMTNVNVDILCRSLYSLRRIEKIHLENLHLSSWKQWEIIIKSIIKGVKYHYNHFTYLIMREVKFPYHYHHHHNNPLLTTPSLLKLLSKLMYSQWILHSTLFSIPYHIDILLREYRHDGRERVLEYEKMITSKGRRVGKYYECGRWEGRNKDKERERGKGIMKHKKTSFITLGHGESIEYDGEMEEEDDDDDDEDDDTNDPILNNLMEDAILRDMISRTNKDSPEYPNLQKMFADRLRSADGEEGGVVWRKKGTEKAMEVGDSIKGRKEDKNIQGNLKDNVPMSSSLTIDEDEEEERNGLCYDKEKDFEFLTDSEEGDYDETNEEEWIKWREEEK